MIVKITPRMGLKEYMNTVTMIRRNTLNTLNIFHNPFNIV